MSCRILMKDATVLFVDLKPGTELTDEEAKVLEEYIQFCRERRAKRKAKEEREGNKKTR